MASQNAKTAANKVSETLRKGKKVNMGKILLESGYSESTSKSPTGVTDTKSFQEEIAPVVKRMERLRDKVIQEMDNKDLSEERFDTLSNSLRNLNFDVRLLSGKSTSNNINEYRDLTDEELRQIASGKGISNERTS